MNARVERLAEQLLRDRAERAEPPPPAASIACCACGRSFTYRRSHGDDSGRFCSMRCREWHDAGNPAYDPDYGSKNNPRWYGLLIGPHGFYIDCAGCSKRFDSRGPRCCSLECERRARERVETNALMTEVGMDTPVKRQCQAPGCTNGIPRWRKGRAVSKAVRYCSPACGRRARKAEEAL